MRSLILIALICTILATLLHNSNAQMPHAMPGSKGIMSRARRAAQGGGGGGGADGGVGASAGWSFGVGANMGGGGQGGGGAQGGR